MASTQYIYVCTCCQKTIQTTRPSHRKGSECQPCATGNSVRKHGLTKTRLHGIWVAMRGRCQNKNNSKYYCYGARGISVCDAWQVFSEFRDWCLQNGYNDTLQIDRIDNDGNYEPKNCRWTTNTENARNKSTTKLTREDVLEIRRRADNGEKKYKIAEDFGVTDTMISFVHLRRAWKDV